MELTINNKTYIALITSFLVSFFIFKLTDNNFSYMRLSFAFILFCFSIVKFLNNIKLKILYVHAIFLALVFFRIINSNFDIVRSLFILSFFLLPLAIEKLYNYKNFKYSMNCISKHLYYFFLFISLLYALNHDFSDRFLGFSNSSTTFSIYLLSFFSCYLFTNKPKYVYVHFIATFLFIYISQTRSVLIMLFVVFLFYQMRDFINNHLRKITFFSIILLLLTLPIVNLFADSFNFLNRYERNETDASTNSRLYYYNNQLNSLSNSSFSDILFGFGIDESSTVGRIKSKHNFISQHNDFFVLLYDYGIFIFVLFIYLLIVKINSSFSLAILLIYLTSFYHNMMYDFWLITFFYLSSLYYSRKDSSYAAS